MEEFLNPDNLFIIVGATENREKWGYKVLHALKKNGNLAVGVNPKYKEIEGVPCYATIREAVEREGAKANGDTVVVTVVPPRVTETVVKECHDLDITLVWMQPGSESREAMEWCEENGLSSVQACIVRDGFKISW